MLHFFSLAEVRAHSSQTVIACSMDSRGKSPVGAPGAHVESATVVLRSALTLSLVTSEEVTLPCSKGPAEGWGPCWLPRVDRRCCAKGYSKIHSKKYT